MSTIDRKISLPEAELLPSNPLFTPVIRYAALVPRIGELGLLCDEHGGIKARLFLDVGFNTQSGLEPELEQLNTAYFTERLS